MTSAKHAGSDGRPPEYSDEALALTFAKRHQEDLRYVDPWKKWFVWDRKRWRPDDTLAVLDLVRAVCREASAECRDTRSSKSIASKGTIVSVLSLVRADRRLAATADQWDADPWLLNTPDGIVDLRTGQLGSHRKEAFCTKITAVAPGPDSSKWEEIVLRAAGNDLDFAAYLQRLFGYATTGSTREQMLAFIHGPGGTGKTTIVSAVEGALDDYAVVAPMEALVASRIERHPTELAMLRGARLVTATETEEGRFWAEARIKQLTGGEKITARFMRQDFFEYQPQFTLIVVGNHRPAFQNVDEAIKRRLQVVPMTTPVPPDERDKDLHEKLRQLWPSILSWIIRGAVEWAENGLEPPTAIVSASASYFDTEDIIGNWIVECCREGGQFTSPASELHDSYRTFCEKNGEQPISLRRFSQDLSRRGLARWQCPQTRRKGFRGLQPRARGSTWL